MELEKLQADLAEARKEIEMLKTQLVKERQGSALEENAKLAKGQEVQQDLPGTQDGGPRTLRKLAELDNGSIERYGRQLILPEIGVKGQLNLRNASVLIVGAGGLGCPSAVYLAAAGIGRLGIVDYDEVELGNLHRQVLHTEAGIGRPKSSSISANIARLNSSVVCTPYHIQLDSANALDVISKYDIVLDCTDNVATRYLLNDACVLAGKPLVSGSALRFEGQLTVYNHAGGPCYRCLYPKPPPPETVTNCSSGGVLGVVPGIIGCLQALEALKIAIGIKASFSQKLLLLDALDGRLHTIRLRPKQSSCAVCGTRPSVTSLLDYEEFCGASATDKCVSVQLLASEDRVGVQDLSVLLRQEDIRERTVLVDVRPAVEFKICRLPHFINVPIDDLGKADSLGLIKSELAKRATTQDLARVLLVCRRGNDSQLGVKALRDLLGSTSATVQDVRGGLTAWTSVVDPDFPKY